jgi:hypothetical protein
MPTKDDALSILTAAHEARRMAYYDQGGGLEYAIAILETSTAPRAVEAMDAVREAKNALYYAHCRATKAEDDAVRALLRAEDRVIGSESGAPDAR